MHGFTVPHCLEPGQRLAMPHDCCMTCQAQRACLCHAGDFDRQTASLESADFPGAHINDAKMPQHTHTHKESPTYAITQQNIGVFC